MFTAKLFSFKLCGFQVTVDATWLILAGLIVWTLADQIFPTQTPGYTAATYWWMGVFGAIGLFFSIVFHELGHALVARRYGIPIVGITLFVFGGVAAMEREPDRPRDEFLMAIAGPIVSLLLAAALYGTTYIVAGPLGYVAGYLAFLNAILAGFNMIPAFPLDGGRVLRAALWAWKDNLTWATRIVSELGAGFGLALIFLGILSVFGGGLISGMWYVLIGFFVRGASRMSFQHVLMRQALHGEKVANFMKQNPVTVTRNISIQQLLDEFVLPHHYKMFPVVEFDRPLGCVATHSVKDVPREQWAQTSVGEIMERISPENTIAPTSPALEALNRMSQTGRSRLMVIDGDRLIGVISIKDLLEYLSLKFEFRRV